TKKTIFVRLQKTSMRSILKIFPILSLTVAVILHGINFINPLPAEYLVYGHLFLILGLVVFAIRRKDLTTWILISIVMGVIIGRDFPGVAMSLQPLSQGFIRLVKTIVGPIIFATLVYGIAGPSDLKQVGRMAWQSLRYSYTATTLARFNGLAAINITQAGVGIDMSELPQHELPKTSSTKDSDLQALEQIPESAHWIFKTTAFFRDVFPENIIKSIHENQVLQIVVFAVIFGIVLAQLPERKKKPIVDFMESLADTMFKYAHIIMYFAPIGVGAAMAYTVGHMGIDILK